MAQDIDKLRTYVNSAWVVPERMYMIKGECMGVAGLGKVRSVVVVKTTIHQTTFRQFIVCNRTVVGNKLPEVAWLCVAFRSAVLF